ncbi:hypothetical protein [Aquimarina sp. 2201CG5-10]|uniref:hypothetical protein n=1 Tax=Aquimarina callyspongiae TaxID=3098150 RepID=UPI002AB53B1F|nr:hypothetical protein [Aquimarina sp. 2201CG5-10]MDY8137679.1 hypothetical protein [Aquimarina sp. 2201CG5-10]
METTENIIMMIGLITGLVLIVFIIAKYNYLIKKATIERGLTNETTKTKAHYLDLGCIVLGLGLGLLVSSVFTLMDLTEDTMDLLIWGTILIFGSIGLIIAHFIRRKFGN